MSEIDDLRHAGFSEDEIAGHVSENEAPALKAAGFSDEEIASYVTGMKNPSRIPEGFIRRFGGAAVEGAKAGFGDSPVGISPEDDKKLQDAGVFPSADQNKGLPQLEMPEYEATIRGTVAAVDIMMRSVNAGLMGLGALTGEAISTTLGQSETDRAKARRDWAQATAIGALLATGETPAKRPSMLSPGVDETIGHLPTPQDFTNATKSVAGKFDPVVRDKIVRAYENGAAHPAEVAADAALDPKIKEQIADPHSTELPERYQAPLRETPDGMTYREGETRPFPPEAERTMEPAPPPPEVPVETTVRGAPVTFPDEDHAALFEFGRKVSEGEQVTLAEQNRLFDTFDGFVTDGLNTPQDVEALSRKYFDTVSKDAGLGEPVKAPVAIEPQMVVDWYRDRAIPIQESLSGLEARVAQVERRTILNDQEIAQALHEGPTGEGQSLLQYLRSQGGLAPSPELNAIFGKTKLDLIRKGGLSEEHALQAAVQGGYFHDQGAVTGGESQVTLNMLREAIDAEQRGHKLYPLGREAPGAGRIDRSEMDRIRSEAATTLKEDYQLDEKTVPKARLNRTIHLMLTEGMDGDLAYERAVMQEGYLAEQAGDAQRIEGNRLPDESEAAPGAGGGVQGAGGERARGGPRPSGDVDRAAPGDRRAQARAQRYKQSSLRRTDPKVIEDFYKFLNDESGSIRAPLFGESPKSSGVNDGPSTKPGPGKGPYFTYDERGTFEKVFSGAIKEYQKTFQPELVSDAAFRADPLFAQSNSRIAGQRARVAHQGDIERQFWRNVAEQDSFEYLRRMERGEPMGDPEVQAKANRHKAMFDKAAELEAQFGSRKGYVDNYFVHLFKKPEEAKAFMNVRIGQLGKPWFEKARIFDYIDEAMKAGLKLKSNNIEDLVTERLLASADMVERVSLLRNLKEMGLTIEAKVADADFNRARLFDRAAVDSLDFDKHGWQTIRAPNGEEWKLAPDVLALWKNAVEARGLYANEGKIGSTFRGWMAFKAVWVPIKLSLSLFHPLHVLGIYNATGFARAFDQISKGGDFIGAMRSLAEGVSTPISTAIPGVRTVGKDIRSAWMKPVAERTPWEKAAVDLMHDGGFVPQVSEELKINAKRALQNSLDKGEWVKAVPNVIRRGIELAQAPIFEEWIPNLKASAYYKDAQALLERRPDLLDNREMRQVALRKIAKGVDGRFGQMFYKNLFWDRYVKDMGIGSFLSLGWQQGFATQFLGGFVDPAARLVQRVVKGAPSEAQIVARDAQNKIPFVLAYASQAMLINGMMTYAFTGAMPTGLDWFLARVGGQNPDGSQRRITNMTYLREIPMFVKHVQEQGGSVIKGAASMLYNKLMIEPVVELLRNRDYYGSNIWDVNSPMYQQAWQAIRHTFGENFNPIAVTGAKRSMQTGGSWWEGGLSFLGFGPAPAYAEKTATQNRIQYLFMQHAAPAERTQMQGEQAKQRGDIRAELLAAKKANDPNALRAAAMKWFAAGGSRTGMSNLLLGVGSDIGMFKALPEDDQKAVLANAPPEEYKKYFPYLKTHTARDVADLVVQAQIARAQGQETAAAGIDRQVRDVMQKAIKDGRITDAPSFQRQVAQEILARRAPDLSAILTQPKRLRQQYLQQQPAR